MFPAKYIISRPLRSVYFTICKLYHDIPNTLNLCIFFFSVLDMFFTFDVTGSYFLLISFLKISRSWEPLLPVPFCVCVSCLMACTCLQNTWSNCLFKKASMFYIHIYINVCIYVVFWIILCCMYVLCFLCNHRNLVMTLNPWNSCDKAQVYCARCDLNHTPGYSGGLERSIWRRQVLPGRGFLPQHVLDRWLWCQVNVTTLTAVFTLYESLLKLSLHLSHNSSFTLGLNTWTLKGPFPFKVCLSVRHLKKLILLRHFL